MTKIKTNKKRAVELCERVLDAYYNRRGWFGDEGTLGKMHPEAQFIDLIPKNKETRALWIFFGVLCDKRAESPKIYQQLADLYKENPEFFDYEHITLPSVRKNLKEFHKKVTVAFHKKKNRKRNYESQFDRYFVAAVERLKADYNYNPLNILNGKEHFNEASAELEKFLGIDRALASLFLIFLKRYEIKETQGLVPKVDTHLQQISARCGVIYVPEKIRVDVISRELNEIYKEVFHRYDFDAVEFNPAAWSIGKFLCLKEDRYLCKKQCPLDLICDKTKYRTGREHATYTKAPSKRDHFVLDFDFGERK